MDSMGCPETLVKNWQRTLRNIREERRPLLLLCFQHWNKILAARNLKKFGKKGTVVTHTEPTYRVSQKYIYSNKYCLYIYIYILCTYVWPTFYVSRGKKSSFHNLINTSVAKGLSWKVGD